MENLPKNREYELNQALEAMHFGFRAMVYKPNQQLAKLGFTRIHHRILYFILKNSGGSVKQLINTLGITKQYLNKPLKVLIEKEYINETLNPLDKRQKQLSLTKKGKKLERELSSIQREKFNAIFKQLGNQAEQNWHEVMTLLIDEAT